MQNFWLQGVNLAPGKIQNAEPPLTPWLFGY